MADLTNRELSDIPVADASSQSSYTRMFEDASSPGASVPAKMNDKLTVSDDKTNPSSGSSRQYNLSEFIPENSKYMPLAIDLIEDIANGGLGADYREVSDLSKADRFQLASDMNTIAERFNEHFGLVPGDDNGALMVEASVKRATKDVVDIDVLRTEGSTDHTRQNRIDTYDPDFWSFAKEAGKEADLKQELNDQTFQYERLAIMLYLHEYYRLNDKPGESEAHDNFRDASVAYTDERVATQMIKELIRGGEDVDGMAELLKENLFANLENQARQDQSENTVQLFGAARFQRYPNQDLQNLIDELDAGLR